MSGPLYKLGPILDHMHACEQSRKWLAVKNFKTFAEAWDACPVDSWITWLASGRCSLASREAAPSDLKWLERIRIGYDRAEVEAALVAYARKHGCLYTLDGERAP